MRLNNPKKVFTQLLIVEIVLLFATALLFLASLYGTTQGLKLAALNAGPYFVGVAGSLLILSTLVAALFATFIRPTVSRGASAAGITNEDTKKRIRATFGRIRAIRSHAQRLRDQAESLRTRLATIPDRTSRTDEVTASLNAIRPILTDSSREIELLIPEVLTLIKDEPELYGEYGDSIASLVSEWHATAADRVVLKKTTPSDAEHLLQRLAERLDEVVYRCCEVTLPSRILHHLNVVPIGDALNFRDAYREELPLAAQRRRFLQYLAHYPGAFPALVEVDNERLLRASSKKARRLLSLVATAVIALGGVGIIWLLCFLGPQGGRPGVNDWRFTTSDFRPFAAAYLFLIGGYSAHIIVNLLKQDREAAASTKSLTSWIMRVHVHEASYLLSAVLLWLGIAVIARYKEAMNPITAFAIGYTYDSLSDLLIRKFDSAASRTSEALRKSISP